MKQATGKTDSRPNVKKVSIQLALDGHSFSIVGGQGILPEATVKVEILTTRTLLVPEELFDSQQAATLLAADGKAPLSGETIVWSHPHNGVIAVMTAPSQALQQVHSYFDADTDVEYITPLLVDLRPSKPTFLLQSIAGYLYIKIYNAGLRLAEVLPTPTETDIRYVLERLDNTFPTRQYALRTAGKEACRLAKLVSNRFRSVRCE
jgi:hypothetical protein